jgi:hypothetical protein
LIEFDEHLFGRPFDDRFFRFATRIVDNGVSSEPHLPPASCADPFDAVTNVKKELGHRAETVLRNVEYPCGRGRGQSCAIDAFTVYKNIVVFTDDGMYRRLAQGRKSSVMKHDSRKRESSSVQMYVWPAPERRTNSLYLEEYQQEKH